MITLGILASTQIAFFRTFESMEVRFSIISIIFQIGFWNYFFHEIKKRFLLKYLSIFVSFVLFVTGYFSPYLGTYWQTVSYNKTLAIKECRGLIVVTTFISARTGDVAISKNEKNDTFKKFSR